MVETGLGSAGRYTHCSYCRHEIRDGIIIGSRDEGVQIFCGELECIEQAEALFQRHLNQLRHKTRVHRLSYSAKKVNRGTHGSSSIATPRPDPTPRKGA